MVKSLTLNPYRRMSLLYLKLCSHIGQQILILDPLYIIVRLALNFHLNFY